ncbi:hypothetical protein MINTM025_24840 [Mycobacterium intracellulare]|nr:hypothetical protein MINTM025_24840 [Mycobacterium intracellulare]
MGRTGFGSRRWRRRRGFGRLAGAPEDGAAGDLPRANSVSAVCRESCQPPWKGANSIGKAKFALSAWAVCTATLAFTLDGFLSDHAMSFAAKVIGR